MSELMWQAVVEVCASKRGGVAGAEFNTDVTFSQCFFFVFILFNVCSSLQSLLCLFEINTVLQDKIQGNLGDFDAQNDVSVWKLQFCFKGYIPRIPSVFRYRGKSLALEWWVREREGATEVRVLLWLCCQALSSVLTQMSYHTDLPVLWLIWHVFCFVLSSQSSLWDSHSEPAGFHMIQMNSDTQQEPYI